MDNTTPIQPDMTSSSTVESESPVRAKLQEKAHEAREQISAKARETTSRLKAESKHIFNEQKTRAADRIDHYGGAIHRAADKLAEGEDAAIAFYTHRAAEQLERAAHYLRDRDWQELRRDAEGFARRHRELFFGGLLLGGLALARLLKASSSPQEPSRYARRASRTDYEETHYGEPHYADNPAGTPGSASGLSGIPTTANL